MARMATGPPLPHGGGGMVATARRATAKLTRRSVAEERAMSLFPTTIAGSLPKPVLARRAGQALGAVAARRRRTRAAKRDATLLALKLQEDAGIDIVTDGEQSRQHFVHGFLEIVDGIDFAHKVEMGIRNDRYKAMVPTVVGALRLQGPRARDRGAARPRPHEAQAQDHACPGR